MATKRGRQAGQNGRKELRQPKAQAVATLTRTAVAVRLGRTISGVRHLEGTDLHPKKVDGVWMFDASEVEKVARHLGPGVQQNHELSPGELAARVCELFRQGKDAVDVVIALRQPFDVVLPLQRAFAQESGSLILSPKIADRLAHICDMPKVTPEALVQALEQRDRTIDELSGRLHHARPNNPKDSTG
jgi:hypothetical protein